MDQKKELTRLRNLKGPDPSWYDNNFRDYFNTTKYPTIKLYVPTLFGMDDAGKSSDANKKSNLLYTVWHFHKDSMNVEWRDKIFKPTTQWIAGRQTLCFNNWICFTFTCLNAQAMMERNLAISNPEMYPKAVACNLRVICTLDLGAATIDPNNVPDEWVIK